MITRSQKWQLLSDTLFDVAIIGGGINGASTYHRLCSQGYRVLLIDKGDFSSGTSQASAMMAWGGLLYLSTLDFASVWQLSENRERLIRNLSGFVSPKQFRYVSNHNKIAILAALYFYWLIGLGKRRPPYLEKYFSESRFLQKDMASDSLVYEEACVEPSDARFVLNWILAYQNEFHVPINYCGLEDCSFDRRQKFWQLDVRNIQSSEEATAKAKVVVNAGGVWTDRINELANIQSSVRHVFGKGVFLGFRRFDGHELPLIVDAGRCKEVLCLIPWGPVSLWGPTETQLDSLDSAFHAKPADVQFLLKRLHRHTQINVGPSSIISLRCGVRPLAVDRSYAGSGNTLEISRRHRVVCDSQVPWISLYGGKITSCIELAENVSNEIAHHTNPCGEITEPDSDPDEMCCMLEDFVRRRTNISQWTPRGGLGFQNENREQLFSIACKIHGDALKAETDLRTYEAKIRKEFDDVIQEVA